MNKVTKVIKPKIWKQEYKSEWHGWDWGPQVMQLNERAEEARVSVNCSRVHKERIESLTLFISLLGCMASTVNMAVTDEKQKIKLTTDYETLRDKTFKEDQAINSGKKVFNFGLIRASERYHDYLKQIIQAVEMGIPIT